MEDDPGSSFSCCRIVSYLPEITYSTDEYPCARDSQGGLQLSGRGFPELEAVFDNHFHLREDGLFLEAVRQFRKEGGTCINLTSLPDHELGVDGYYQKIYDRTVRMAARIRNETDVKVVVTVGPYPLDYFLFRDAGREPVSEMTLGIELAAKLVSEGVADAIGEVGRPHFPVDETVYSASNMVMSRAMQSAREAGCPVILHTEDLDCNRILELERISLDAGIRPEMVVKHHSDPLTLPCRSGIVHSVLATRPNIREAISSGKGFMMETDYVDDPLKPGKVIAPFSVPRRARAVMQENENWYDILHESFIKIPGRLYGIDRIL